MGGCGGGFSAGRQRKPVPWEKGFLAQLGFETRWDVGLACYLWVRISAGRCAGVRHGPPWLDGAKVPCVDALAVGANGRGVVLVRCVDGRFGRWGLRRVHVGLRSCPFGVVWGELQGDTGIVQERPFLGVPQTVVTDLVESLGQDML